MGNNIPNNNVGPNFNPYYTDINYVDNEPTLIIKPFLYLGGMYARKNPRILEYLGVTHVLNMAAELHLDTVYLTNRNIIVKHIPAEDYETYNIRQHFEEAFQFIEDALAKNGRILIHCAVGVSRSPTIVMAYIMFRYGMTFQQAFQYVQSLRPSINPNNSFRMQLQEFEYELNLSIRPPQAGVQAQAYPQATPPPPPPQQTTLSPMQQAYIGNPMQNVNTTNNFSMNGINPISMKVGGTQMNYVNRLNNVDTSQVPPNMQGVMPPTAAAVQTNFPRTKSKTNLSNQYYMDPLNALNGMYINNINDALQIHNPYYMLYYY